MNDLNCAMILATLDVLPPEYGAPAHTLNRPERPNEDYSAVRDYYCAGLMDVPDELTGALVRAITNTCEKRPLVPKILDLAAQIARGPRRPAGEAFAQLNAEIRRKGRLHLMDRTLPRFDDEALNAVVAAVGWEQIVNEDSPVSVWRGQFVKLYQMAQEGQKQEPLQRIAIEFRQERAALAGGEVRQLPGGTE